MAKNIHHSIKPLHLRASVLAVASSLALCAAPMAANAAGLGKIVVFSALGQPLRAEIEVTATREELSGMRAQLASREAFKQAGLDYVLLVGDVDVLPVRYMVLDRITPAAFDYSFYPSDLYYADLAKRDRSFESWNAQTNGFHAGYYGEVRGEKNKADPVNFDEIDYFGAQISLLE